MQSLRKIKNVLENQPRARIIEFFIKKLVEYDSEIKTINKLNKLLSVQKISKITNKIASK